MAFPVLQSIGVRTYSTAGDDGFGNPVESWSNATTVAVYAVAPGTPGEDYEPGRIASRIPLVVLGPSSALSSIGARDLIVWGGREYEVDGEPENFDMGPFGFEPGCRVRMIRIEG
jgi:hypothetical protein